MSLGVPETGKDKVLTLSGADSITADGNTAVRGNADDLVHVVVTSMTGSVDLALSTSASDTTSIDSTGIYYLGTLGTAATYNVIATNASTPALVGYILLGEEGKVD